MAINGAAIESLFDFEAMSKGFTVSAPLTDKSQYDRIVDVKGTLHRVQVKARRTYGKTTVVLRIGYSKSKRYTSDDIEIIALYIEDNNSWYLFPVDVCSKNIRVNIKKDKTKDKYKNNWTIFYEKI